MRKFSFSYPDYRFGLGIVFNNSKKNEEKRN